MNEKNFWANFVIGTSVVLFVMCIIAIILKDSNKILLNTELISLDLENKIAKTNKGDIKFEQLISTLPFNKINPDSRLSANKVAVFNLGFDKGSPIQTHWRYFPGSEVFYRVGFYNNDGMYKNSIVKYYDTTQIGSRVSSSLASAWSKPATSQGGAIVIGTAPNTVNSANSVHNFNGTIGEIRIYDHALTPEEVLKTIEERGKGDFVCFRRHVIEQQKINLTNVESTFC